MRTVLLVVVTVLLTLTLTAAAALAAGIYRYRSGGPVTAVETAVTMNTGYRAGVELTAIPGAGVTVHIPANQKGLLIITFSAEERCAGSGGECYWTAFVDGKQVAPTKVAVDVSTDTTAYESRSFQWVSGTLGPGDHSVTMAAVANSSTFFDMLRRTLTVFRSKV